MTGTLVRKLLRDVRTPLLVMSLLLFGFQCLWARVTESILGRLLPAFTKELPLDFIKNILFQGPGKITQALMGGESIHLDRPAHMLSIGYVHPFVQTILCIWAIGRAAGAIAGEIDKGTMELLLAQPVARSRLLLAHLCVDLLTIPVLCLSLWAGTWVGTGLNGWIDFSAPVTSRELRVDPRHFAPALLNAAALVFAVSGYTMWLSAAGRFRTRILSIAILLTLLQFLLNTVGQLWNAVANLRPLTVFYYYQPQPVVLQGRWTTEILMGWRETGPLMEVPVLVVLTGVGLIGYIMAWRLFCRRDLPAPL